MGVRKLTLQPRLTSFKSNYSRAINNLCFKFYIEACNDSLVNLFPTKELAPSFNMKWCVPEDTTFRAAVVLNLHLIGLMFVDWHLTFHLLTVNFIFTKKRKIIANLINKQNHLLNWRKINKLQLNVKTTHYSVRTELKGKSIIVKIMCFCRGPLQC